MDQTVNAIDMLVDLDVVYSKFELWMHSLKVSFLKQIYLGVLKEYPQFPMPLMSSVVKR